MAIGVIGRKIGMTRVFTRGPSLRIRGINASIQIDATVLETTEQTLKDTQVSKNDSASTFDKVSSLDHFANRNIISVRFSDVTAQESAKAALVKALGKEIVVETVEDATVPVTVVQVDANIITQLKNQETDGYCAVQISTGERKASRVTKPEAGHYAKANVTAGRTMKEFRLSPEQLEGLELGQSWAVERFYEGQVVDVTSTSKGKGFAGTVKRHNFRTQDATHGNSLSHRVPGSTGQNQTPGKVFKGKKMAGQMGNVRKTVQNQEIIQVDTDKNIILVKGGIPGAPGTDVIVKPAVKREFENAGGA